MLKFLFSPKGRISRSQYLMRGLLPIIGIGWLITFLEMIYRLNGSLLGAYYLIGLWAMCTVTIKRWHDVGKSGWWILVALIPIVGPIWNFTVCVGKKGDEEINKYGDPAPEREDKLEETEKYCPSCSTPYYLSDYREDADEIFCSGCNTKLEKSV